jgi:hypothetical protein
MNLPWAESLEVIESAAPAPQTDWQSIETAPKDGRTLLLGCFNKLGNWRTMRGQWFSEAAIAEDWEEPDDAEEGWYETAVEPDVPNCWRVAPTHWMPLPAAPGAAPAPQTDAEKLIIEAREVFDLMLQGCNLQEFGDYQNGHGETIGPRMDALHAKLRSYPAPQQSAEAPVAPQAVQAQAHLPGWERGIATVTLTGHQLRHALGLINSRWAERRRPDGGRIDVRHRAAQG